MKYRFSSIDKWMAIAFLIGLAIRLGAIPFTMTDEADAVTRIFITLDWLKKPELITSGVWGPLHYYLIAFALLIWNNTVYSPVVLHSLFSAATAIPLYIFVKREWNEKAALFAGCVTLVYPVAIRYGLVALSEVPFIFFIALTLMLLSFAKDEEKSWGYALLAGLTLTLAGALRFEAWGLTPFLGIVLWKKWKKMFVFFAAAAIFPVFWMAGSYLQYKDPLYSLHWTLNWNTNIEGLNEELSTVDIINRATYFPRVLVFGLTPITCLVSLIGMVQVVYKRRKQWIWLVPLVVLFITFTVNTLTGTLSPQVRYSLSLGILMIPFTAEWFDNIQLPRRKLVWGVIVVASMLPLSYLHYAIPWPFDFPNPIPAKVSAYPRIETQTQEISKYEIEQAKLYPGGLLLDFSDWADTYYVALMANKSPDNIFIMPGEVYEEVDPSMLATFLKRNPTGMVLLTANPRFMKVEQTSQGSRGETRLKFLDFDQSLSIESIGTVGDITYYKYSISQ